MKLTSIVWAGRSSYRLLLCAVYNTASLSDMFIRYHEDGPCSLFAINPRDISSCTVSTAKNRPNQCTLVWVASTKNSSPAVLGEDRAIKSLNLQLDRMGSGLRVTDLVENSETCWWFWSFHEMYWQKERQLDHRQPYSWLYYGTLDFCRTVLWCQLPLP